MSTGKSRSKPVPPWLPTRSKQAQPPGTKSASSFPQRFLHGFRISVESGNLGGTQELAPPEGESPGSASSRNLPQKWHRRAGSCPSLKCGLPGGPLRRREQKIHHGDTDKAEKITERSQLHRFAPLSAPSGRTTRGRPGCRRAQESGPNLPGAYRSAPFHPNPPAAAPWEPGFHGCQK